MKRWIAAIFIIVLIAGAVFTVRALRGESSAVDENLQTVEATRDSLMATIGATGTVRANQRGTIAFQTTGIVENVFVATGEVVAKGDVLANLEQLSLSNQLILAQADLVSAEKALEDLRSIEDTRAAAQLALAQAQDALEDAEYNWSVQQEGNRASAERIAATEANLVLAQNEVDQAQKEYSKYSGRPTDDPVRALARSNLSAAREKRDSIQRQLNWYLGHPTENDQAILDAEVELAKANLLEAEREWERLKDGPDPDDIAAAEARVAAAQANLNLVRITAPFQGTVTAVDIMPGDQVSPGQAVIELTDLSKLFVDVEISEVDINQIQVGQKVTLTFDAILDQQFEGEIVEVSLTGTNVQGVVNFNVTVEMTDLEEGIRPGLTAAVNIIVSQIEDALLVPNRAVRVVEGERVVYVLRDGKPQVLTIELGASSDLYSEVVGGELREGDLIILNPTSIADQLSHPSFISR
jgi:HlyD family secretion protein